VRQLAIATVVVESVAHHEEVGYGEADVIGLERHDPAAGLIEEDTAFE
jgi:hypothetical protein